MKKQTKIIIASILAVILILAAFIVPPLVKNEKQHELNAYSVPLTAFASSITPMSVGPTDPITTTEGAVYTKDKNGNDKRVFLLDELGILVDENGTPITEQDETVMTTYNADTQEYIDGANRALGIFLDSHVERHYLLSGGKYTTTIRMDKEVFLINYKTGSTSKLIYAFREKRTWAWYEYIPIVGSIARAGVDDYNYFDMNGRQLDTDNIDELKNSFWLKTGKFLVSWNTLGFSDYAWKASFADIREKTTLAELTNLMTHSTTHPWQGLTDENNNPVVTEDGQRIRVNPTTKQLTDDLGWALFNSQNGYPIVYVEQDIVTIPDMTQQAVTNGVLENAITVTGLLDTGVEFYMGSINTQYGSFDVPVFASGDGGWTFTNGDDATDIINDMELGGFVNGKTPQELWDSIVSIFNGENTAVNNFVRMLGIIAVIIVVIILLPVITPIISVIITVIAFPFKKLAETIKKSKKKDGDNANT
jgi:hypothetical protein